MKTWILISNVGSARILSIEGNDSPLRLEFHITHTKSQAMTTDKPGRGRTSKSGRGMFSMPSRMSGKDLEGEDFAHKLSQVLRIGLAQHKYQKIALLAPPHFLGLLSKRLGPEVNKHVVIRQDSDYTHVSTRQLPRLLAGIRNAIDVPPSPVKTRDARQRRGQYVKPPLPLAGVEATRATADKTNEVFPAADVAARSELAVQNLVKKAMGKREWSQERLLDLARQEKWPLSQITRMLGDGRSFTRRRYRGQYLYSVTRRRQSGRRTSH
jgi:protein required for attachment to host cells